MADGGFVHIAALSRNELQARWEAIYRTAPPRALHRGLLERAVAWHEQARREGGLPVWVKRELSLRRRAEPRGRSSKIIAGSPPLQVGARLVREWGGRTHIVEVMSDGFLWNGTRYRSLSAIAKAITGARWSGPRFFGLDRTVGKHL